jgi:hydrogenase nickel incorporation protein HypB
MCATCGCEAGADPRVTAFDKGEDGSGHAHSDAHPHEHVHPHGNEHAHQHEHRHQSEALRDGVTPRTIQLEQEILARNDRRAERNRGWLAARGMIAWNLMSAPGSGKTTLLERTVRDLGDELSIGVIEGDQATLHDAERIRAAGGRVVQINTGTGCHLDAGMIAEALQRLDPPPASRVIIENVGNLVCPALFDLGEAARVAIVSVTEGEDKPIKYPHMFRAADVMILNKIDLLPYVRFDAGRCVEWALKVNARLEVLRVSALTGEGMDAWYAKLRQTPPAAEGLRP